MRLPLGALAVLLVAPAAAGQSPEDLGPYLEVSSAVVSGFVPIAPASTTLAVTWMLEFDNPLLAITETPDYRIDWSLECTEAVTFVLGNTTTLVALEPGRPQYAGTAFLTMSAASGTVGMLPLQCLLHGEGTGQVEAMGASDMTVFDPVVEYVGGITARVLDDHKASGPQKMIRYNIEVTNTGNALTQVTFEILEEPGRGKWNAIMPDVVILEPHAQGESTKSVVFTVATPFHNGYNSDRGTYVLRLVPSAAADPMQAATPVDIEMRASAQGWYIPGPSPVLLIGFLALAALAARRVG